MYGRMLTARIPERHWYDDSPFITTFDSFGAIDNKALDAVQEAYLCCADHLPQSGTPGDVWVCNICDRVWAIPVDQTVPSSWTLTKMKVIPEHEHDMLAYRSHQWKWRSIVLAIATVVISIVALFLALDSDVTQPSYVAFLVLAGGLLVTGLCAFLWRKLMHQYNLSLSDN